jgi:hypothetical protein
MPNNPYDIENYIEGGSLKPAEKSNMLAMWTLLCVVAMMVGGVAWLAGRYVSDLTASPRTVTVLGVTQELMKADQSYWQVDLVARGDTLADAYQRLEANRGKFGAYVQSAGVGNALPTFGSISVVTIPNTKPDVDASDAVLIFTVKQTATIALTGAYMPKVEILRDGVKSLINDKVEIHNSIICYEITAPDKTREAMIARALASGLLRGEAMAKGSNAQLGTVQKIEHGFFQVTALNSPNSTVDGRIDHEGLDKVLKLGLRITYALK